jgi:leader peptidase (prepilin peptidase)/N-methyltransferase
LPTQILGLSVALFAIAAAIAYIDWRRQIIPDSLNIAALALGEIAALAGDAEAPVAAAADAAVRGLVTAAVFLLFREIYQRLRGREGLGLGDVKLAAAAGAWLDWSVIPIAVALAAFSGLLAAVAAAAARRRLPEPLTRLPFGAFFAPSIWLVWTWTR